MTNGVRSNNPASTEGIGGFITGMAPDFLAFIINAYDDPCFLMNLYKGEMSDIGKKIALEKALIDKLRGRLIAESKQAQKKMKTVQKKANEEQWASLIEFVGETLLTALVTAELKAIEAGYYGLISAKKSSEIRLLLRSLQFKDYIGHIFNAWNAGKKIDGLLTFWRSYNDPKILLIRLKKKGGFDPYAWALNALFEAGYYDVFKKTIWTSNWKRLVQSIMEWRRVDPADEVAALAAEGMAHGLAVLIYQRLVKERQAAIKWLQDRQKVVNAYIEILDEWCRRGYHGVEGQPLVAALVLEYARKKKAPLDLMELFEWLLFYSGRLEALKALGRLSGRHRKFKEKLEKYAETLNEMIRKELSKKPPIPGSLLKPEHPVIRPR